MSNKIDVGKLRRDAYVSGLNNLRQMIEEGNYKKEKELRKEEIDNILGTHVVLSKNMETLFSSYFTFRKNCYFKKCEEEDFIKESVSYLVVYGKKYFRERIDTKRSHPRTLEEKYLLSA